MDILIVSDSHGSARRIESALARQNSRVDLLIHLGDGLRDLDALSSPVLPLFYALRGNCDFYESFLSFPYSEEYCVSIGSHTALLTHGARYGVKSGLGALIASAAQKGADLVLYGHTHVPHLEILAKGSAVGGVILERPMYVFNPGSIAQGSFGTLVLQGEQVLFSHGML